MANIIQDRRNFLRHAGSFVLGGAIIGGVIYSQFPQTITNNVTQTQTKTVTGDAQTVTKTAAASAGETVTVSDIQQVTETKTETITDSAAAAGAGGDVKNKDGLVLMTADWSDGLDPLVHNNYGPILQVLLYDRLLQHSGGSIAPTPRLAESWERSDDAKTHIYNIVKGATFHSGNKVDAHAVKKSFERSMKYAGFVGGKITANLGPNPKLTTPDDYTLKVETTVPTIGLEDLLSIAPYGHHIIDVDHILEVNGSDDPENPPGFLVTQSAGGGPYVVDEWIDGEKMILKAWDGYWGPKPKLPKFTYLIIRDDTVGMEMLKKGDADFYWWPSENLLKNVVNESWDGCKINGLQPRLGGGAVYGVGLNHQKTEAHDWAEVFNNGEGSKHLKHAMSYAIPYQDILDGPMAGFGKVPIGIGIWPGVVGYTPEPRYSFNMAKAKAAMAKSHYPDGLDLGKLAYPDWAASTMGAFAVLVQAQLAELGITVEPYQTTDTAMWSDFRLGKIAMMISGTGVGRYMGPYASGPAQFSRIGRELGSNSTGIADPDVDKYFDASLEAATEWERNVAVHNAIYYLRENPAYVNLVDRLRTLPIRTWCKSDGWFPTIDSWVPDYYERNYVKE